MLASILLFLFLIIVFGYQPFTATLTIPSFLRIPVLLFLALSFAAMAFKEKKAFNFFVAFCPVALIALFLWRRSSPESTSLAIYTLSLVVLAVSMFIAIKRIPYLIQFLTAFIFVLVISFSVLSIISFLGFNLKLFPYQFLRLGGFDFYEYYYNPLLGYIAPKRFESGTIGRVTLYMFEPSYLSWFLTTNFFLIPMYVKNDGWKSLLLKPLVFAGAMCTFSTGAWVVFGALFSVNCARWIMGKLHFRTKTTNRIIKGTLILIVLFFMTVPAEVISGWLGTSSFGDRDKRTQSSLLFLATANVAELALGRSPGYIEGNSDAGESNQYIKLIIEEGIIGAFLVVGFIIACTRNNDNYLLATLLFLNSVVILWTPLFMLNILVCKFGWGNDNTGKVEMELAKRTHA